MLRMILPASMALLLVSCSKENAPAGAGDGGAEAVVEQESAPTGNRFFDAAVKKIHTLDAEVSPAQASEIVTTMTADGKIGLGEINSMDLNDLSKNSDTLQAAYAAAKAKALAE